MARKSNDLTACMLMQDFEPEHWEHGDPLTQAERDALDAAQHQGDIGPLTNCIVERLTAAGYAVAECYGIIHDQDIRLEWSVTDGREIPAYKTRHGHWVLKFSRGGTLDKLAAAVGLEPQYVEKPQRGRFAYDNMLAYLVHVKYADKHPYDPAAVYTAAGKPYDDYVKERWGEWLRGRGVIEKKRAIQGIDDLEEKILTGQVTKQQILRTDELFGIYARNKRRCDTVLDAYIERKADQTVRALNAGEFKLTVYFITGPAGAGKTRFAVQLCNRVAHEMAAALGEPQPWRTYSAAASNPMDDYGGEEIMLMDDVRGATMTASDWLKLLDPYNISPLGSRYHNTTPACRVIVITSSKSPLEFFYYCRNMGGGDRSEAMDQFFRRLQSLVQVIQCPDDTPLFALSEPVKGEPHTCKLSGGDEITLTRDFVELDVEAYGTDIAAAILTAQVMANHHLDGDAYLRAVLSGETVKQLAGMGIPFTPLPPDVPDRVGDSGELPDREDGGEAPEEPV